MRQICLTGVAQQLQEVLSVSSALWDACDKETQRALRLVSKSIRASALRCTHSVNITVPREKEYKEHKAYTRYASWRDQSAYERPEPVTALQAASLVRKLPGVKFVTFTHKAQDDDRLMHFGEFISEVLDAMSPAQLEAITACTLNVTSLSRYKLLLHGSLLKELFNSLPSLTSLSLASWPAAAQIKILQRGTRLHTLRIGTCKADKAEPTYASLTHYSKAVDTVSVLALLQAIRHMPQLSKLCMYDFDAMPWLLRELAAVAPQLLNLTLNRLPSSLHHIAASDARWQKGLDQHAVKEAHTAGQGIAAHPKATAGSLDPTTAQQASAATGNLDPARMEGVPFARVEGVYGWQLLELCVDGYVTGVHRGSEEVTLPALHAVLQQLPSLQHLRFSTAPNMRVAISCTDRSVTDARDDPLNQGVSGYGNRGCRLTAVVSSGTVMGGVRTSDQAAAVNAADTTHAKLLLQQIVQASSHRYTLRLCDGLSALAAEAPGCVPQLPCMEVFIDTSAWKPQWEAAGKPLDMQPLLTATTLPPSASEPEQQLAMTLSNGATQEERKQHQGAVKAQAKAAGASAFAQLPQLKGLSWSSLPSVAATLTGSSSTASASCTLSVQLTNVYDNGHKYSGTFCAHGNTKQCPAWAMLRAGQAVVAILKAFSDKIKAVELSADDDRFFKDLAPGASVVFGAVVEALARHTSCRCIALQGLSSAAAEGLGSMLWMALQGKGLPYVHVAAMGATQ